MAVGLSAWGYPRLQHPSANAGMLSVSFFFALSWRVRHRGLPVAIARAGLLPCEHLAAPEEEDAQIRMDGTMTINRGIG